MLSCIKGIIRPLGWGIIFSLFAYQYSNAQTNDTPTQLTAEEINWIGENPVVLSSNEADWSPFDFTINGNASGFSVDYLNLAASKVGLQIEYVNEYSWAEQMNMLKSGEIDLANGISFTPERSEYLLFTEPYLVTPLVYFGRADSERINSIEDLSGKKVGLISGGSFINAYNEYFPEMEIYEYSNIESIVKAIASGEIDITSNVAATVNSVVIEHNIDNVEVIGYKVFPKSIEFLDHRIAVRNEQPVLKSILDKAVAMVNREEIQTLSSKWIDFYNINMEGTLELNQEELNWLSKNNIIRIASATDALPFEATDQDGNISGIAQSYLEILEEKLNVKFVWSGNKTWTEGIDKIKNGEAEMFTLIAETEDRKEFLTFTDSISEMSFGIFTRKGNGNFRTMEELAGSTVVRVRNTAIYKLIESNYTGIKFVDVDTVSDALDLLAVGGADAFVDNIPVTAYNIANKGMTQITITGDAPFKLNVAMAVRKDLDVFANILRKTVDSITQEEKNEILQKWMSLSIERSQDNDVIWQIVIFSAVVISIIILWNISMRVEVNRRKKIEQQLIISQKEANEANNLKSRFLANMSHEIRTPLNAIMGFSEVMSSGVFGPIEVPKYKEYLEDIKMSGEHLATIIKDIMDLTEIEDGKWKLHEELFDLEELIDATYKMLQREFEKKNITFKFDGCNEIGRLKLDADKNAIMRILLNLLSNSIKFTPIGGKISIVVTQFKNGGIELEVVDNGAGIPANLIDQVVRPFEQLPEQTLINSTGTGLGLSITKQLANYHGGSFSLTSTVGEGTSAKVFLPRDRVHLMAENVA